MKKIILNTIVVLLLLLCNTVFSQISSRGPRGESSRRDRDEFLDRKPFLDDVYAKTPCYVNCTESDIGNLTFTGSSSFETALGNHNSIVRAAKRSYRNWYNKQKEIIKKHLEDKFNEKFSNYEAAKNKIFFESEVKNIKRISIPIRSKYYKLQKAGLYKQKIHKKELKLLRIWEAEIKAGNTKNSKYAYHKVGNIYLKEILPNLLTLKSYYWNPILKDFETNTAKTHININIYKEVGSHNQGLVSQVINLKNNYYNRFNDWDKLDFMQFLINFEKIKSLSEGFSPLISTGEAQTLINRFSGVYQSTAAMIENSALKNRKGGYSIFDKRYIDEVMSFRHFNDDREAWYFEKELEERIDEERAAFLDKLLNNVEIDTASDENSLLNYFIDILKLKDEYEIKWIKDYPDRMMELEDSYGSNIGPDVMQGDLVYYSFTKPELAEGALIVKFIEKLGIDNSAQKKWLYSHTTEANELIKFANENGGVNNEVKAFINSFLEITNEIPTAKFLRYKELINLIKNNPFALLEDCIQQNGLDIENYKFLYNHTLPSSCKNRLNSLGQGFNDQPLNTGNAVAANVDYYGVEITQNPDFNLDGIPDTDAQVFNAYKANFTDWASGQKNDFQFSCNIPNNPNNTGDVSWSFFPYYPVDATIWNSSNPLTAIIRIDADSNVPFGDLISDDGAIMISAFTSQYWIGSTVQTFITGTQPFSGNRQWGYLTNENGSLELYARAVDVARVSNMVKYLTPGSNECKEDTYYNIGETTWSNLQEEIKKWVNANGGQATVVPKTAVRFDKTKLKELLEKNESIDQINCK